MRPRGRPKKDKFADLDSDFKDAAASMSEAEIRKRLSEIALNQVELVNAKEVDDDLKAAKFRAREAGAIYREGSKMNKLRTEFLHRVLGDAGKDTGSFEHP
jgi:hypothetical protein